MTNHHVEAVVEGLAFPEAPRWHDGALYFSDFYTHLVHRLGPTGVLHTVAEVPGQPSGLGFAPDGALLIASMVARRVYRLAGGELAEIADLRDVAPYHINDLIVDREGRAYVGNFGSNLGVDAIVSTDLIRVDPDRAVSIAAEDLIFPNGMVITPDGHTFLIAETFAYRITAFDVTVDGALNNRREWARFGDGPAVDLADALASGNVLPDGMALDAGGRVWVADAYGSGALLVAAGGQVLDAIEIGDLTVFGVALGGH